MPNIAEGILQEGFVKEQTTFDAVLAFATTDAVSPIRGSLKIEPFQNYSELKEAAGTASLQGEVKQDRGGKWSMQCYVKPAAAGTPPDIGPALIKAAMGVETINGGTSTVYTLSDTVKTPLQIAQNIPDNLYQIASGAWVEEMTIEVTGNDLPIVTFSGGFARYGWLYETNVGAAGMAGSVTQCPIDDADIGSVGVGSTVQFTGENNGGAGFIVTAVDNTAGSANFDFTPAISAGGVSGGEPVTSLTPSQTTGGTVIGATECTMTIDTVSLGFNTLKVTLTTGIKGLDQEATADRANRLARGERRVAFECQAYYLDDSTGNAPFVGRAWDGDTCDIDWIIGPNTTEERMKLSIPKGRIAVSPIEIPEAEESMVMISGVAHQSAAAADEFAITFD